MKNRKQQFNKSLLVLGMLVLMMSSTAFANVAQDDHWGDAFENIGKMIKCIEMGEQSCTERVGNQALAALEKSIDRQNDQSKRDKLRDTVAAVREAIGHAGRKEWDYAESAAKRAGKLIEEAR
jgi:hypothetical protein